MPLTLPLGRFTIHTFTPENAAKLGPDTRQEMVRLMPRGKWLDKLLHDFTVVALMLLFVLLVYLTWKMLGFRY